MHMETENWNAHGNWNIKEADRDYKQRKNVISKKICHKKWKEIVVSALYFKEIFKNLACKLYEMEFAIKQIRIQRNLVELR